MFQNLYNCGKVCLSLLGTWSAGKGENWDANASTMMQARSAGLHHCICAASAAGTPHYLTEAGSLHLRTGREQSLVQSGASPCVRQLCVMPINVAGLAGRRWYLVRQWTVGVWSRSPTCWPCAQVLVSIQSLILVPQPYFNEPGYESSMHTERGRKEDREYSANIREQTMHYAIQEQLRSPPHHFEDAVRTHFRCGHGSRTSFGIVSEQFHSAKRQVVWLTR